MPDCDGRDTQSPNLPPAGEDPAAGVAGGRRQGRRGRRLHAGLEPQVTRSLPLSGPIGASFMITVVNFCLPLRPPQPSKRFLCYLSERLSDWAKANLCGHVRDPGSWLSVPCPFLCLAGTAFPPAAHPGLALRHRSRLLPWLLPALLGRRGDLGRKDRSPFSTEGSRGREGQAPGGSALPPSRWTRSFPSAGATRQ